MYGVWGGGGRKARQELSLCIGSGRGLSAKILRQERTSGKGWGLGSRKRLVPGEHAIYTHKSEPLQ